MSQSTLFAAPLLGALCVDAGLISQDDLDACLARQREMNDGTPIGQILLQHGYISSLDLALMLAQQQSFRRTISATLDGFFTYLTSPQLADYAPISIRQTYTAPLRRVR